MSHKARLRWVYFDPPSAMPWAWQVVKQVRLDPENCHRATEKSPLVLGQLQLFCWLLPPRYVRGQMLLSPRAAWCGLDPCSSPWPSPVSHSPAGGAPFGSHPGGLCLLKRVCVVHGCAQQLCDSFTPASQGRRCKFMLASPMTASSGPTG